MTILDNRMGVVLVQGSVRVLAQEWEQELVKEWA